MRRLLIVSLCVVALVMGRARPVAALDAIRDVVYCQGNAPTITCPAFSVNPASGDLIVVGIVSYIFGSHSASDTGGVNSYTQIGSTVADPGNNFFVSLWYSANVAAGSVQVRGGVAGGTQGGVVAWLIQGAATTSTYNSDTATRTGSSTTNPTGNASSPAPSAESIFIAIIGTGNVTVTDTSGWNTTGANGFVSGDLSTTTNKLAYASNAAKISMAYKIASSAQTPGWSTSGSTNYSIRVASFKGTGVWSGAGGGATFPALFLAP